MEAENARLQRELQLLEAENLRVKGAASAQRRRRTRRRQR